MILNGKKSCITCIYYINNLEDFTPEELSDFPIEGLCNKHDCVIWDEDSTVCEDYSKN